MPEIGKSLVVLGAALVAVGALLWSGLGRSWIGRLPGDFHFKKGGGEFYFPLATCVVVSVVFSLISWLLRGRR